MMTKLTSRQRAVAAVALAVTAVSWTTVLAATQTVSQRGGKFDAENLSITRGETVVFRNDDMVRHNVLASAGPEKFNLGMFRPGEQRQYDFAAAGTYQVRCGIHPQMKLQITVR